MTDIKPFGEKMKVKSSLLNKIKDRTANVGVIGLGYVGLPLVIEFVKAGFPVTGFDVDAEKVKALKAGKSYIKHIPAEEISKVARRTGPGKIGRAHV